MAIDWSLKKTKETLEQENIKRLEQEHTQKIVSAIREKYSIDAEYKCLRLGILNPQDPLFIEYNKDVNEIKAKF